MSDYKPEYVKKDDFIAEKRWLYCEHCKHREGKKRGKQTVLYEIGEAPCKSCGINDMLEEIEYFHAADVRENTHGTWKHEHQASTSGGTYAVIRCSECGWAYPISETKYCPSCGAQMEAQK